MDKVNNILKHHSKYSALRKPLEAAGVCETARVVADGRFSIISFKNGLLTVGITSSAQAMNLQAESPVIIKNINDKIGRKAVEKIRYKIQ